jgi:phosphate uptake regulator
MRRKIVKQGPATLMISLPAKWAQQYKLNKGDEVDISIEGNSLVVVPEKVEEKSVFSIYVPKGKLLKRYISTPYREGYDSIKIKFEDPAAIMDIESAAKKLIGFEIIEQGTDYCVIGPVAKEQEEAFELILKRCFLLIKSMAHSSYDAINKKKYENLAAVANMESSVHSYCDFTIRILNRKWKKPTPEITRTFWTITIIKEISDLLAETCNTVSKSKQKLSPEVLGVYKTTANLIEKLGELNYNHDADTIIAFKNSLDKAINDCRKIIEKHAGLVNHLLLDILERMRRAQELYM